MSTDFVCTGIKAPSEGLLLHAIVHPADIQDRDGDGGVLIFSTLFGMYRFCKNFLLTGAALGVAAQGRPIGEGCASLVVAMGRVWDAVC
jgi:hypothetical protein